MYRLGIVSALLLVCTMLPLQALAQDGMPPEGAQAPALAVEAAAVRYAVFQGAVDHAAAGCGLRNFDSCTISLRGIPGGSTVIRAFVYWAMLCPTSTANDTCPRTVDIEFDGRTITSRLICTGANPCWAGGPLGTYLVDVTGLMPGVHPAAHPNKVINGDYRINAIPSNPLERDGRDPWVPVTPNVPKAEGATLVVVYSNPALSAVGKVYIHHGCDTALGGTLHILNALVPAAPSPVTAAKFTRFGADGQVGSSVSPTAAADDTTWFGGPVAACVATTALTQIAGPGSLLNADSDWNGSDGGPLNQLWDTHTSTVTSLLKAGAANYCVRYTFPGDCVTPIGYVLTAR